MAVFFLSVMILSTLLRFSLSTLAQQDRLSSGAFLLQNQTLVSAGGSFALGFFSPNDVHVYAGIWYHGISERTVVWVANRDSPLTRVSALGASASLAVLADGTAAVLDGLEGPVWSTVVAVSAGWKPQNATLTLMDTGNLVLTWGSGDMVWQSFDHPTDTLLPTMSFSSGVRLVSWKNSSDPSAGDFYIEMDNVSPLQILLRRRGNNETLLRYGLWSGKRNVIPIPGIGSAALETEAILVDGNDGGRTYYTFTVSDPRVLLRMYVTHADPKLGEFKASAWNAEQQKWILEVSAPYPPCEVFNRCGPYGVCDQSKTPLICSCLEGFDQREPKEWNAGNFSGGCVRREPITRCTEYVTKGDDDDFVKVSGVRLPDEFVFLRNRSTEAECAAECTSSCSCNAYAYRNFSGWDVVDVRCLLWHGELKDMVIDALRGGDFYIRLARTGRHSVRKRLFFIIPASVVGLVLCMAIGFILRNRRKKNSSGTAINEPAHYDSSCHKNGRENGNADILLMDFKAISSATNNFSFANKLGEGGFGPVYKGQLMTGQDVAVKRLSHRSRQGIQEFMNEVELIGKLQHTNLVRLLGWCTCLDEKILVYEYLPNKSLDKYLFDENLSAGLKWSQRFCIIEGIAQGLLYLHRFSRVRIIHRDLKTSNILLDTAMNPKISDFGLAKIFGGNQAEGNTDRVLGTYGYMSPEYAIRGLFSEKSDVFSFGVIVLEVISGKKNTINKLDRVSFYLLNFAWKLWNEGRGMELVDPAILSSAVTAEVETCLQVGLLCVQPNPADRPDVSTVLSMLGNKTVDLPRPEQSAYVVGSSSEYPSTTATSGCPYDTTRSTIEGR